MGITILVAILTFDARFLANSDCLFEHDAHLLGYFKQGAP